MIFSQSFRSELSNTAGAVFTVLFCIVFSVSLVRILGEANIGRVDDNAVFSLVALSAITSLPTILTLSLFMSILATMTRAYRDSEMSVWFACGQSLVAWIRPVLMFSLPVVSIIALLCCFASPWAQQQIADSKVRYAHRDDISRINPGRFIESPSSGRVIFSENVDILSEMIHNLFVHRAQASREELTVSERGHIFSYPDGARYLELENGRRYQFIPGQSAIRELEFEKYDIRLDAPPPEPILLNSNRSTPTHVLLRDTSRASRAELLARVGQPIAALLLALLAVPMAHVRPRAGRSMNLFIALLIFLLYQNFIEISQAWVIKAKLSPLIAGGMIHFTAFLLMASFYLIRLMPLNWRWVHLVSLIKSQIVGSKK